MSKKAQAWGFDLLAGITIFMIGLIVFYFFALNYQGERSTTLDSLTYEGGVIADTLLSEGIPSNWTSANVIRIGITNNNKINNTKLFYLKNLAATDYNLTRSLFNTKYHYYINFSEEIMPPDGGQILNGIGLHPSTEKDLIRITRFTSYEDTPMVMTIDIWQ